MALCLPRWLSRWVSGIWRRGAPGPACRLCGEGTRLEQAYEQDFARCGSCGFIFKIHYEPTMQKRGLGFAAGVGGGFREYFLVDMLRRDLGMTRFLLFGTGNTPTFARLREEGLDVTGCDISLDLVDARKAEYGQDAFYSPDELPADRTYDGIVAVEVIEHFAEPAEAFGQLFSLVNDAGCICGTTDFWLRGSIEEPNKYMNANTHVAYWSEKSIRSVAGLRGWSAQAFEMVRPGSVLPDEKFGVLWPNKRVFFLFDDHRHGDYFRRLKRETPILPIDQP